MHMSKSQNPLQIKVGDVVEIHIKPIPNEPAFQARVTEIHDRVVMGQDAIIYYRRLDGKTNEPVTPDGCSVSHVLRVVTPATYVVVRRPPKNHFAELLAANRTRIKENRRSLSWLGYDRIGGIYLGEPSKLAMIALASATDELTRMFDNRKFEELWSKAQFIGQVANPDPENYPNDLYTSVRWKIFKRWVLRNRHRFLCTIKQMEQSGRKVHRAFAGEGDDSFLDDDEETMDHLFEAEEARLKSAREDLEEELLV